MNEKLWSVWGRKAYRSVTVSAANFKWTGSALNPGLLDEKLYHNAFNRSWVRNFMLLQLGRQKNILDLLFSFQKSWSKGTRKLTSFLFSAFSKGVSKQNFGTYMKICNWNLALCNQNTTRNKILEQKTHSLGEKAINKWTESGLVIEFSSPEGQQENTQCPGGNTRWNIQSIGSTDFCYGVG